MKKNYRSDQILKDIQKVNLRVDTLIAEIKHNILKTNQELDEMKRQRDT